MRNLLLTAGILLAAPPSRAALETVDFFLDAIASTGQLEESTDRMAALERTASLISANHKALSREDLSRLHAAYHRVAAGMYPELRLKASLLIARTHADIAYARRDSAILLDAVSRSLAAPGEPLAQAAPALTALETPFSFPRETSRGVLLRLFGMSDRLKHPSARVFYMVRVSEKMIDAGFNDDFRWVALPAAVDTALKAGPRPFDSARALADLGALSARAKLETELVDRCFDDAAKAAASIYDPGLRSEAQAYLASRRASTVAP